MDRRDPMMMPGSASLYMQRGMAGSRSGPQTGFNVHSDVDPLSGTSLGFQSTIGASTIESRLPIEPPVPVAIPPPGVNFSAPSTLSPPGETVKRKRGRPRKYGPDGAVSLALSPTLPTHQGAVATTPKRGRGRPSSSGKKQQLASLGEWLSGSAGIGFTPHVITVAVGEDIASKIMAFSQQGPRAFCVLSAVGSISTATLRQPATSGGLVTYEGLFEILCLSGSYLLKADGGSCNGFGSLSVSLASPDGHVIGGGVGGMLVAASPVLVILGSFIWGVPKTKNNKQEGQEVAIEKDHQTAENPVIPATVPPSQSLAPTSSLGAWPDSRQVDMHNTHVDIDLMRG